MKYMHIHVLESIDCFVVFILWLLIYHTLSYERNSIVMDRADG